MRFLLVVLFGGFLAAGISARADTLQLVVVGDSLTAGYQLAPEKAFPVQLQNALTERGHDVAVINASVSGDTSSGGLSRLDWSVGPEADAVILELGANDALRGIPPARTRDNIDAMVRRLTERGLPVLVAGMLAPRNLGEEYAAEFDPIFSEVSSTYGATLYPFFLEGVALDPALNLPDGMHPNGDGVSVIVQNMLPTVEQLLARAAGS